MKRRIAILGSTGSIGGNAVKVIEHLSSEFELLGVAGRNRLDILAAQAKKHKCKYAVVADPERKSELASLLPAACEALGGLDGMIKLATAPEIDMVLCSIVGTSGLFPVLEAIRAGKDIALASKELLVMAGEIIMEEVKKHKVKLLPVDSEHSAIFQCLEGKNRKDVSKIILTASGGPFKSKTLEEMASITYESALKHPTWNMGPKVTVDSATLMNKALEIIEAHWLFGISGEDIRVVIHPQSIIHSMVEFIDSTVIAQMSNPDMRFSIHYALTYPHKCPGGLKPLDFAKLAKLTFEEPDRKRFPSLDFAYEALRQSGTMPAVMNAANEAAVESFRKGVIKFTDIWKLVEKVMSSHKKLDHPTLDAILKADQWARAEAVAMANCEL